MMTRHTQLCCDYSSCSKTEQHAHTAITMAYYCTALPPIVARCRL
jgi:hypothetical protein